jgi:multicomponent Na+:H+ antiporter subunit C
MLQFVLERANYWAIIGLMMVGLYIAFQSANMIKRLVGLSIFQTSVFLFYITLAKVAGGSAPILFGRDAVGYGDKGGHGSAGEHVAEASHGIEASYGAQTGVLEVYSNPLPHVLILTAIVVGVSTLSVGLALVVRIRESYGSIESDEVRRMDILVADAQDADELTEASG